VKNSDFVPKIYDGSKKPNKTRFEVGFLGGFFGFYWAGFLLPTLAKCLSKKLSSNNGTGI
jgi:hypothetical protein